MNLSTDFLSIGPAHIFIGTAGDLVDELDIVALESDTGLAGWTHLGQTTEAVEISDSKTFAEARSEQSSRTLDVAISARSTMVKSTLRELQVGTLASILHGTATTTSNVTDIAPQGLGPVAKFAVAAVGSWPGGRMLWVAPRCVYKGDFSISKSTQGFDTIPFEIEVLETSAVPGSCRWTAIGPAV